MMIQVTVKLDYKGRNDLTNVIVNKDTPENQILKIAQEQIKKQWLN